MKKLIYLLCIVTIFHSCGSDDTVILPISPPEDASLKVTNTVEVTTDANNLLGNEDVLTYTIQVKNIGNVPISDLSLNNIFTDLAGNALSLSTGPNFSNADAGSNEGSIQVDETATYTATYIITQSEVDAGGLSYSAIANGNSPEGNSVSDVSDNGIDSDGNSSDDPTVTIIEFNPTIIAECHFLNSSGTPRYKLKFDSSGLIEQIYFTYHIPNPDEIYLFDFTFDSNQKLINLTKNDENGVLLESYDIVYDSQDRVISIGETQFEFVEDPGYYFDPSLREPNMENTYTYTNYYGDVITESEFYYTKHNKNDGNPLLQRCFFYESISLNETTGEREEHGYCSDFISNQYNGNVIDSNSDEGDRILFGHDNHINPMYSNSNIISLYTFLKSYIPSTGYYDILFFLFSENNYTSELYAEPLRYDFEYIYNSNNHPVSANQIVTDLSTGDSWNRPYSIYYYQGDEIPD